MRTFWSMMHKQESVWEQGFLRKDAGFHKKAQFEWYSRKAYQAYAQWIDSSDKLILDAGFGTAQIDYALAQQFPGSQIWGIDISFRLAKDAKECTRYLQLQNSSFVTADIFALPFGANTFDVVLSDGVIGHLPNYEAAFQELVRIAKPGGKVLVGTPNWYCFPHTFRKFLLQRLRVEYEYGFEKSFTHQELRQMFQRHQLQALEITGYRFMHAFARLAYFSALARFMRTYVKFLSPLLESYVVLCQRMEDTIGAFIDRITAGQFSNRFGFYIVIKGEKMASSPQILMQSSPS